jgi:hypothetical protein
MSVQLIPDLDWLRQSESDFDSSSCFMSDIPQETSPVMRVSTIREAVIVRECVFLVHVESHQYSNLNGVTYFKSVAAHCLDDRHLSCSSTGELRLVNPTIN